jgi:hypothetical protein
MSTVAVTRGLPVIDRTAIRIGTRLVAWGRARGARREGRDSAERYRADYDERVRTAGAFEHLHLMP